MKITHKNTIIGIIIIILILTVLTIKGFYDTEFSKKPILEEKISSNDYNYLYDFYVGTTPNLENRPYYGSNDANIKFILYTDLSSEGSKYFFEEIYPLLYEENIATNKIQFYHKHHLTLDDIDQKTRAYELAMILECFYEQNQESYYDFYFKLQDTPLQEVTSLIEEYGLSRATFITCVKQQPTTKIIEDISEVDNFGMIGIIPRIYIGINTDYTTHDGVPSYQRLQRTLRDYQTQLGD